MMPTSPPSAQVMARLIPEEVTGYSYGTAMRIGALLLVAFSVLFAVGGWTNGVPLNSGPGALIGAVALGMCVSGWYIVMGKTTVNAEGVSQEWVMPKSYKWEEIFRARLVKLPMNTRLIINTGKPPFKTIHAGTPELREVFERIARMYTDSATRR